ncbi:IctB family putative bicarbonate transporter [Myxacorys almedinensis]|uniref:Putative bicarbonate transporter, IctB family n=1 Tax=Myxacorys almedinensis A TaxID=2690445 RepID=A0A8J7Z092_9CYAN|nr:IctB family putative bicarbonate transporter [Myxacorys almedinensis]NDJ17767.1 putative bicarbonate transporter, IctB family [Myxacorys almedinensis A]
MNSVWQQITLASLPLYQWRGTSYLHRIAGFLRSWRKQSFLMQWADPIGAAILCVLFGVAPFVSTDLIGWLLAACAAYWVLLTLTDDPAEGHPRLGLTPIHLPIALFLGVAAVSAAVAQGRALKLTAFVGVAKLSLYLLLFALMARILRSPKLRSWVIGVYLHVALIVSGYGLRQWFFGADALATWVDPASPLANSTRVYSFLGNPNLLAGYLIPAIAFSVVAIFAWRGWLPKTLAVVMTVTNTACLILTQSRGGWIGLALMVVALFVMLHYWWSPYLPKFWRYSALPILFLGLAGMLVLGVVFVPTFRYRITSIFAGSGDSSNAFRLNVWAAVLQMIQDYPVLGIGPGDQVFKKVYPLYQRPRFTALSAYSIVLEITVEMGFIGLFAFLWLLLVTFNQGGVQLRRLRELSHNSEPNGANRDGFWLIGAVTLLVGMLGHGLVDTVWYRPSINILWWLGVAIVASFYTYQQKLSPQENAEHLAKNT